MDSDLTLNMILDLPTEVLKKSEEYDEYAELLRKELYLQHDIKELKQKIDKQFNRFKDIKYTFRFPLDYNIKTTVNYTLKEESFSNIKVDKVSNLVTQIIDDLVWITNFYNSILYLASKFTLAESVYFVETFFGNKSEDLISEKLGVSRNTLIHTIKKSCIVKAWLVLNSEDE